MYYLIRIMFALHFMVMVGMLAVALPLLCKEVKRIISKLTH